MPRERQDAVLNQGIITDDLLGEVEIRFPVQHDIKGLTVEFGKAYPVDFSIVSDEHTVEITGNDTWAFCDGRDLSWCNISPVCAKGYGQWAKPAADPPYHDGNRYLL